MSAGPEAFESIQHDADSPLNVVARGDDVVIYVPGGRALTLSAGDAQISARRLLDAAEIAQGRLPSKPA